MPANRGVKKNSGIYRLWVIAGFAVNLMFPGR
jgi:hypothetical protein